MNISLEMLIAAALSCLWFAPRAGAQEQETLADQPQAVPQSDSNRSAAALAHPGTPPEQAPAWEFSAKPYLWMAGIKGDVGIVAAVEPVAADISFGDIIDSLKFALMGTFDAKRGRFVASADMMYLKIGASNEITPRGTSFIQGKITSTSLFSTLTAGYRAVDQGPLFVDLFTGGRINRMRTGLDLTGPRRAFSGTKTETWFDPVFGTRFHAPLGQGWSASAYGDVGGFGVGSDLTWQLMGQVNYDLSRRWSLHGGWRHLDIDYENKGFVFDAAIDGPIVGATYRF